MLIIPYATLLKESTSSFDIYDSLSMESTTLTQNSSGDLVGTVDWLSPPLYILSIDEHLYISYLLCDLIPYITEASRFSKAKIKDFYKNGSTIENQVVYNQIITVTPGSEIFIPSTKEVNIKPLSIKATSTLSSDSVDIENALVNELKTSLETYKDKKVAFALSGGVDSTLLVALAKAHTLYHPIVCYTADTGQGNDLYYAKLAAEQLGIELKIIKIPYGNDALEEQKKLIKAACAPISFVGNSIGFSKICEAAASDGFDAIIDGTAADQIFAGTYGSHGVQWYFDALKQKMYAKAEQFKSRAIKEKLVSPKKFKQTEHKAKGKKTFSNYLYSQMTQGTLQTWLLQHRASAQANNIQIITPFLTKNIAQYIWNPLDAFYQEGINKFILRTILSKYLSDEIAWRVDNQGLRWPTSILYKRNNKFMKQLIKKHARTLSSMLSPFQLYTALLGQKTKIKNIYALAVLLENEGTQNLKKTKDNFKVV